MPSADYCPFVVSLGGQPINGHPAHCGRDPPGERAHHWSAVRGHRPLLCFGQDVRYVLRKLYRVNITSWKAAKLHDSGNPWLEKHILSTTTSVKFFFPEAHTQHRSEHVTHLAREHNSPLTAQQHSSQGQLSSAGLHYARRCFLWCGTFFFFLFVPCLCLCFHQGRPWTASVCLAADYFVGWLCRGLPFFSFFKNSESAGKKGKRLSGNCRSAFPRRAYASAERGHVSWKDILVVFLAHPQRACLCIQNPSQVCYFSLEVLEGFF